MAATGISFAGPQTGESRVEMSQADWVKGREATLGELQAQVMAAEASQQAALDGVQSAQAAFDESGSDAAAKGLQKARSEAALAEEHVARARRLLAEGEARAAEQERQRLLARKAELEGQLSHQSVRAVVEPLLAQELALLEQVARFRADKLARGEELKQASFELLRTRQALGEKIEDYHFANVSNPLDNSREVETMVNERARVLDEPMRSLLRELAPAEKLTYFGGVR